MFYFAKVHRLFHIIPTKTVGKNLTFVGKYHSYAIDAFSKSAN